MYLMGTNFDIGGIISLLISDEGVEEPGMEPYMECVINEVQSQQGKTRTNEHYNRNNHAIKVFNHVVPCLPGNRYIWFPR